MVSSVKTSTKTPTKSALKTSAKPTKAAKVQDKAPTKAAEKKKAAEKRKTPETIDSEDEERATKKPKKSAKASAPEEPESEHSEAEETETAEAETKKAKPKVNRPLPEISFSELAKAESAAMALLSSKEEDLGSIKDTKKFPGIPIPDVLVPYFNEDGNYFLSNEHMNEKQRKRIDRLNEIIEEVREGGVIGSRDEVRGTVGRVVLKCLQHLDKENNLGLSYDETFTDKEGNEKVRERLIIRCKRSAIDTISDALAYFMMMLIHASKQCAAASKRMKLMPQDVEFAVNANRSFNNIINAGKVNRFRKATASSGWLVGQARSRHIVSRLNKEKKMRAEIKAREKNDISLNKTLQGLKDLGDTSSLLKSRIKRINDSVIA